jgi:tape measure domain-containing protein
MAKNLGSLIGEIGADISGWKDAQKQIGQDLKRFQKEGKNAAEKVGDSFEKMGRKMQSVGKSLSLKLTAPLVGIGAAALKTAAKYQDLQISLQALTGSAEKGTQIFKQLKNYVATTPFRLKGIASAENLLIGMGLSAQHAFKDLKQIADIAALTGSTIKDVAFNFGQAAAQGNVMTRDIRQFANEGLPILTMLSKSMGVSKDQIFALASQGKITFKVLEKAFAMATSAGGRFANGTEKMASTISGSFSTLEDNVEIALGAIGKAMFKAFHIGEIEKAVIKFLEEFTHWFDSLSDSTKRWIFIVGGLAAAIGPALIALGGMLKLLPLLVSGFTALGVVFNTLFSPITAIIAAIGALAAAAAYVYSNWKAFKDLFIRLWDKIKNALVESVAKMIGVIAKLYAWIPGFGKAVGKAQQWIRSFKSTIPTKTDADKFKSFGASIKATVGDIGGWISGMLGSGSDSSKALDNVNSKMKAISDSAKKGVKNVKDFASSISSVGSIYAVSAFSGSTIQGGGFGNAKPFKSIAGLKKRIQALNKEKIHINILANPGKFQMVTDRINKLKNTLKNFGKQTTQTTGFWNSFVNGFKATGQNLKQFLATQLTNSITSFAETLGKSIFGAGQGMKSGLDRILNILLSFAKTVGEVMIAIGTAMIAGIITSPEGVLILGAGVALTAIASGVQALIKQNDQGSSSNQAGFGGGVPMAQGGIVPSGFPNDSYPAMLTSGETVTPPKKLPSGHGESMYSAFKRALNDAQLVADGSDLRLVIHNSKESFR